MLKRVVRQKYFVSKELRISIALIILWSLLVAGFFTYFAKELGEKIGSGALLFVIIMLGYLIIVVVLTMFFSHRLIGPFQRLKMEMKLIRSGDYHRRLNVRKSDDIYIMSFVTEVNKILAELDKAQQNKEYLVKNIDSEMISIISVIEEGEISKEKLRESILACHKKLKSSPDKK